MERIVQYVAESAISLSVLYLFYWLVLRNDTNFRINRLVLMASLFISIIIPSISRWMSAMPVLEGVPINLSFSPITETQTELAEASVSQSSNNWNIYAILAVIYIAGALLVFGRLFYQAVFIQAIQKLSKSIRYNGYTIVSMSAEMVPFSYFRKIFIPAAQLQEEALDSVIEHERSHLSQGHYVDLFIVELLTVLQWFNPFIWLFEKSIKEVHEFLADRAVLSSGTNKGKYQAVLVNQALGGPVFILTNQFNQSLIKKRIIMMKNSEKSRASRFKALLMLPVIAGLIMAFANPPVITGQSANEKITVNGTVSERVTGKPVPGSVIVIKGTTIGTITDAQGNYQIMVNSKDDQLIISMVGYRTQEVSVGNNKTINVLLEHGILELDFSEENKLIIQRNKPESKGEYVYVEELPAYPGGTEALHQFLMSNMVYPENAKKKGIQGTVLMTYIIDANGEVTSVKIIRGVEPEIDQEAMRLTKTIKGWKPAAQNGKPVSTTITMPIEFKIK